MDLLLHNLRTGGTRHDDWSVAREAADEIERLREALKIASAAVADLRKNEDRLRSALQPFAEHPEFHASDEWAVTVVDRNEPNGEPVAGVTAGDFRRAAQAMQYHCGDPYCGDCPTTPNADVTGCPPGAAKQGDEA